MIIASGLIIVGGFVLLSTKMSLETNLKILGYGLWMDIGVSAMAYALHWGTFTGVMAAAFAGLLYSVVTTLGSKVWGYIKGGKYYRGVMDYSNRLPAKYKVNAHA